MNRRRRSASYAPTVEADRHYLEALLRRIPLFRDAEVKVALEVLDVYLSRKDQEDYQIYTARRDGKVCGYVCFGNNNLTEGTFELYWIAVDPAVQGQGIGTAMMELAEGEALRQGGRMMVLETSSRADYLPTLAFYRRLGYEAAAAVPDFYAVGDDKLVLVKDLSASSPQPSVGTR